MDGAWRSAQQIVRPFLERKSLSLIRAHTEILQTDAAPSTSHLSCPSKDIPAGCPEAVLLKFLLRRH